MKTKVVLIKGTDSFNNYCRMSSKGKRQYEAVYGQIILMAVTRVKTIKGKLILSSHIADFILTGKAIKRAVTLNVSGYFTVVWTDLVLFGTKLGALDTAQGNVVSKVAGAVATRDELWIEVELLTIGYVAYINGLARNLQIHAVELIQEAMMTVIIPGDKNKPFFAATRVPNQSGKVKLAARSVAKAKTYEYQQLIGDVWTDCTEGKATEIMNGLTPMTKVFFRYRAICTKGVKTDWSDPVYVIVL